MARNKKVEILSHSGQVLHPITDGDCVIFPDGETLARKLSEQEEVMYTPEVVNSSPMFKVGEGDSSDYSANVLDGAYQEAVLKGQTYVNTIQEPSADVITLPTPFTEYERTQSKTFTEMNSGTFGINLVGQSYVNSIQEPSKENYVALGEALEFQNKKVEYTSDGQIKSAMLNGMTLVNLARDSFKNIQVSTDETVTSGPISMYNLQNFSWDAILKPNTKYNLRLICKFISGDTLANNLKICWYNYENGVRTYLSETGMYNFGNGIINITFTTPNNCNSITLALNRRTDNGKHTSTYEYSQGLLLEYQEGMENWEIPYFQGMQSVTMSTELENVCSRYNSSSAKNGKTFTVGSADSRTLKLSPVANISNYNFKQNTKYLLQFKITNLNLDGLNSITLYFSEGDISGGNALFGNLANASMPITKNGIYRIVLTTSNIVNTSGFVIKGIGSQWENSTLASRKLTISNIMCIEYQNGMENWDLPYFETTQLMKPVKVQSVNKNLFNINDVPSSYSAAKATLTNNNGSISVTSTSENGACFIPLNRIMKIKLRKDKVYILSFNYSTNNSDANITLANAITDTTLPATVISDVNGKSIRSYTPSEDVDVFLRLYAAVSANGKKGGVSTYSNIQLEECDTATDYTPHQSKTTSALEPITLRAIGNVKDTLDLSTGEYVQRIGEIVLDGSSDESITMWFNKENNVYFGIGKINNVYKPRYEKLCMVCDKLPTPDVNPKQFEEGDYEGVSVWDDNFPIVIGINKNRLQGTTVSAFRQWLQQNPIKIQYRIVTTARKISLEYPNLQTYQDITHVQSIAMDGTLIPNIYLPSDIVYKTLLKPNTKYNLQLKQNVVNADNPLTVNVGGAELAITQPRTLITTPSTLTSETVSFTGKGNNIGEVMLIENSTLLDGDIPYFEGIGDVHLGRVVENLCLANENLVGNGRATASSYENRIEYKITSDGSLVACFPLTKELINGKKYFVYCPWNCSSVDHIFTVGFQMLYNNSLSYGIQNTQVTNKKYAILTIDEKQQLNPYTHITIGRHGTVPVNTTMTIRRPIICEYIEGMENWDWESIGYFTGTRNIGNEFMRIGNKNLFDLNAFKDKIKNESCFTILDNGFKADCSKGSVGNFLRNKYRFAEGIFKENTQYTISWDVTHEGDLYLSPFVAYTDGTYEGDTSKINGKRKLTTAANKTVKLFSVTWLTQANGGKSTLTNIQIEEASSATSYVTHKHNSLHILPNEQIPLTFEQGRIDYANNGTWANAINNTSTQVIRTQLLDLEPNETYRVSCGHSDFMFAVGLYNNSLLGSSVISYTSDRERYITTTKDVHKIGIATMRKDSTNITPSVLHQVRLEKVTDVTLRSIGSVKDELDLTRGVYIQRIGEIVVNGSEISGYATNNTQDSSTMTRCFISLHDGFNPSLPKNKQNTAPISNQFIGQVWYSPHPVNRVSIGGSYDIHFIIYTKDLPEYSLNGCKAYFKNLYDSGNPVIVQYVLETPIEHKINIPMKNELNQTIAKPNGIFTLPLMYSETNHVDINSQIYPKVQSRDYISYPVIASPSNKYTVFHNKVGSTDLIVNLCGASTTVNTHKNTITTPSTISQYELRLSGANNKVSNVCVFNGDYMNVNVPYVQGMMNAVNPIVTNTGKNLFDISKLTKTNYNSIDIAKRTVIMNPTGQFQNGGDFFFKVKKNEKYVCSVNIDGGNTSARIELRHYNDGQQITSVVDLCTSRKTITAIGNEIKITISNGTQTSQCIFRNIQIEETSTPSQYEPYKENNCEPENGQVYLTQDMFEQGSMSGVNGAEYDKSASNARIRTKELIKIKPSTNYIFKMNDNYNVWIKEFDAERKQFTASVTVWSNNGIFTTKENTEYISFIIRKGTNNTSISVSEFDNINPYLCELDKEIHLRSLPNGVRDELNLETGEYIQRIGEVVLDGSDDEKWGQYSGNNNIYYGTFAYKDVASMGDFGSGITICDKLNTPKSSTPSSSNNKYCLAPMSNKGSSGFTFSLNHTETVAEAKKWLQANPVTVQYLLKTPIIKHIDIHNYPHSYKDGHVIIENNDPTTSIPAQLTYKAVTNRSGQIQEHTEQVEKQERQINELETLILENIRQNQNRSQNFLTSLISTLEIEEE